MIITAQDFAASDRDNAAWVLESIVTAEDIPLLVEAMSQLEECNARPLRSAIFYAIQRELASSSNTDKAQVVQTMFTLIKKDIASCDAAQFIARFAQKEHIPRLKQELTKQDSSTSHRRGYAQTLQRLGWRPQTLEERVVYYGLLGNWKEVGRFDLRTMEIVRKFKLSPDRDYYDGLVESGDDRVIEYLLDNPEFTWGSLGRPNGSDLLFEALMRNQMSGFSIADILTTMGITDVTPTQVREAVKLLDLPAQEPSFFDLFLAVEVARSSWLQQLAQNPSFLIISEGRLEGPYYTTEPRISTYLPPEVLARHTERPALETIPRDQLIRLHLLHQALQDPKFLGALGESLSADIATKTREYGGSLHYSDGRLRLVDHLGVDGNNGVWDPRSVSFYFSRGNTPLMHFHHHALTEDDSCTASPSGLVSNTGGDMAFAEYSRSTGALFTTMGHPKDAAGNPDQTRLNVNVDMFYVDRKGEDVVFDLGTVTVLYERSEVRQDVP